MEKFKTKVMIIELPARGLKIKGLLLGSLDKPTAVIVHGKPGSADGFTPRLICEGLKERGISSVRLAMYLPGSGYRDLEDCTLDSYTKDFEAVVDYMRLQGCPKIFAVGHSYGALAVLKSSKQVDGIVLQEPLHGSYWAAHPRKSYKGVSKVNVAASRDTADDLEELGDTTNWASDKGCPMKIISAERGFITEHGERYLKVADKPNEQVVIENANHQLSNSITVVHRVVEETVNWLSEVCLSR